MGEKDTLLHRETLLVVSTSDTEDVTLPFVTQRVTWNFLGHFLVVEDATKESDESQWISRPQPSKTYYLFSSSRSMSFWAPVAGSNSRSISCSRDQEDQYHTGNVELHSTKTSEQDSRPE